MKRHSLELLAALVVVLCSALPAAHAEKQKFFSIGVRVKATPILLVSLKTGETVTAWFESDMTASLNGEAQGNMRFTFERGRVLEYHAIAARVDLTATGEVSRVWVSLVTPPDDDQQSFATTSITPEASEHCLIYDILGPDVHDEPATFEVPGMFSLR